MRALFPLAELPIEAVIVLALGGVVLVGLVVGAIVATRGGKANAPAPGAPPIRPSDLVPEKADPPRPSAETAIRVKVRAPGAKTPAPSPSPSPSPSPPSGERPTVPSEARPAPAVGGRPEPRVSSRLGASSDDEFDRWRTQKGKAQASELEEQNIALNNVISMLPGFTRKLSETTHKREIAPILAEMITRLCLPPPERVAILFLTKSKEDLILAAQAGFDQPAHDATPARVKVPRTHGRVGHAIRLQMTMDVKDFEREDVEDVQVPGLDGAVEIAAPLVYNKEALGVVVASGFPYYSKLPKRLIGVTADLAALAISLAEKTAQIQLQANLDALTGCYNKRYFLERVEFELDRARAAAKPLSLFMFDIDHFKTYNDRNGHQAGDEALKITGQLLNARKRDTDVVARYGGEEFIVIMPGTNRDGAYHYAETFRALLEAYDYPHGEGQPLGKVTVSGGVATFPEDGVDSFSLIEAADSCLYESKRAGRNHITRQRSSAAEIKT